MNIVFEMVNQARNDSVQQRVPIHLIHYAFIYTHVGGKRQGRNLWYVLCVLRKTKKKLKQIESNFADVVIHWIRNNIFFLYQNGRMYEILHQIKMGHIVV